MKNQYVAAILAIFLGGLGIHKFYLGQNALGVIYLLFCWTFIPSIIAFIEGIIYLTMPPERFNEKYNKSQNNSYPIYNPQNPNSYQHNNQYFENNNNRPHNQQQVNNKYCQNCGSQNKLESRFCKECGSVVE